MLEEARQDKVRSTRFPDDNAFWVLRAILDYRYRYILGAFNKCVR